MSAPVADEHLYRSVTRAMQLWADAFKNHQHVPQKHYEVFLQLERTARQIRKDWA